MKKLYSLLIFAFLGLNSFAQCGEVDNQGYYGYFVDGSGTMNYDNNTECSWLFTTPVQGGFAGVGFYNFSTEFNYDYVRIYDGADDSAPLIGEFSGSTLPVEVQSTGQDIFVTFSSDFSNTSAGFDGYWTSSVLGTLTECAGYLDDGLVEYPNDVNLGWLIQPLDSPDEISFTFDYMDMENCCDFISVYDGFNTSGELLGSFNGTTIPPTLVAYSGSMYLAFTTDISVVSSGWGGSWSTPGLWYIPSDYANTLAPMIYSCNGAPAGYFLADQSCAEFVLAGASFCINTDWDSQCQDSYEYCLGLDDCVNVSLIDPNVICPGVFDPVCGCDNVTYSNSCLAIAAGVTSFTFGDCSTEIFGCTDFEACNYDSSASVNDGSCTYPGCTFITACNYDLQAGCNDESCFFIGDSCNDGNSNTVNDMIQNNCDCEGEQQQFGGCTDVDACNYNSAADFNDGSCTYPGCTIMMACNYDSQAGCNDESCFFIGDSCNDGNSNTVNDMIQNNCDCEGELQENEGCIDPLACNFNPEASIDDGSCEYLELYAIIGSTTPDPLTSVDYFYSSTMGSSYVWQASNGAVTAGQGTASVTVVWGELGLASISVTEMSEDGCEGDMVMEEFNISSTSMTEISAESLSVYPNPASSFLIIKSDLLSSGNSVIKLIDSKGRLVLEDTLDKDNRLDVSGVANGVYFLSLINDQKVENLRIVIQK